MVEDLRFLFRFRDLVAETITRHQEVIYNNGSVWWGWWKRPSEDNRADVWDALKSAAPNNPVTVGLFDSGTHLVYRAKVIAVIPPVDEHAELMAPPDDKELVPAYYRESPFSRAWMRMSSIELLPEFFGRYSFAKAPNLPNYKEVLLKKFVGKKIVDASELRGMDTTIWEIQPSKPNDPDETILLSTKALAAAVTKDVLQCKSNRILHITDPHFALGNKRGQHVWRLEGETDHNGHTLSTAIKGALGDQTIGAIIVTGDLTFMGSPGEFTAAELSLNRLLGLFDLSPDHLIVIPGNHDIQWSTDDKYKANAKVLAAPATANANYSAFYRNMFAHPPSPHLAMGRRLLLPSGLTLEIAALNSSSLMTGKNFLAGMGRIDEASFEEVRNGLGWDPPSTKVPTPTAALRMLAIHHHLTVTEDIEPASGYPVGYGMAVDAVRIQRLAAENRVQLALHGHKHRAFLWRSSVYSLPEFSYTNYKLGEISIVGGGSAGSEETESDSNYFNLLDFAPAGMQVTMYRSRAKGMFTAFKTFCAPFGKFDDGSLRLEDWIEKP
jgi:3',5'-cyclic AMP phosphodiesterase CpdA